jgi:hypothetical protein
MARVPTAPLVASGLVGGYLVARETKVRPLGGAVLGAFGLAAALLWRRRTSAPVTGLLLGTYVGGFGLSHPLAKRVGAWPAVLGAAAVSAAASWLLADRRRAA